MLEGTEQEKSMAAERTQNGINLPNNHQGDNKNTSPPDDSADENLAPDGGYGWVIVMASFLTNMIVDGVCFR